MFKETVGKRSKTVKNIVERGAVKKFATAIGDAAPIYVDEEVGKQSRYKQNIAPPTFPVTFEYAPIKTLQLPEKGLIHGEQKFHYERPLIVGETIYCYATVKDYYERTGNFGEMGFLVVERYGKDEDDALIYTEKQVVIISEEVRKGLAQ